MDDLEQTEKVYVVTTGSYSDYAIEAIFKTQELADHYVGLKNVNNPNERNIEVWDLNTVLSFTIYQVGVFMESGELARMTEVLNSDKRTVSKSCDRIAWGYGKTPDHALKSARDIRAKLMAEKERIA